MVHWSERPAAGGTAHGSILNEQLPGRLENKAIGLFLGVQAVTTSKEAVEAMIAAGASFAIQHRADALGVSFTYRVEPGGNAERARAIVAIVKAQPPTFLTALKALVQQALGPLN